MEKKKMDKKKEKWIKRKKMDKRKKWIKEKNG